MERASTHDRSDDPARGSLGRVVVTGAAGFIGGHVCRVLRAAGHEVIPLVRPGTSPPVGGEVVDLTDLDEVVRLLRSMQPDAVCHAAWSGHPRSAGTDYRGQITDSLVPTATLGVAVGLAGVQHLVLLSSGGSVGRRRSDGGPPGAYGWAKGAVEGLLAATATDFGFTFTALRPSAVYGPGQDPRGGLGVVSVFVDHVLRDEPVVLLGSGQSGRDFLHVEDLAACIQRVIEIGASGTFEVGGPEVICLDDLLRIIEEELGRPVKVVRAAATGLDPELVALDNGPLERVTGWVPRRRLVAELCHVVDDIGSRLAREAGGAEITTLDGT